MTRHPSTVDCVGGPADGEQYHLEPGTSILRVRNGGHWHQYRLRPTDLGLCLVWEGVPFVEKPYSQHAPAEHVG